MKNSLFVFACTVIMSSAASSMENTTFATTQTPNPAAGPIWNEMTPELSDCIRMKLDQDDGTIKSEWKLCHENLGGFLCLKQIQQLQSCFAQYGQDASG